MSDIHVYQRFETSNSNETVETLNHVQQSAGRFLQLFFFIPIGAVGRASRDHGAAKVAPPSLCAPRPSAMRWMLSSGAGGVAARCEAR